MNYYQFQPRGLRDDYNQQLPDRRQQGFGTHFKDSPPAFIEETKVDNKIERVNKPKCPKVRKVCKNKRSNNKRLKNKKKNNATASQKRGNPEGLFYGTKV